MVSSNPFGRCFFFLDAEGEKKIKKLKNSSYDPTLFGTSGNMTVNGTLTCVSEVSGDSAIGKRGLGAGQQNGVNLNSLPYAINNGKYINENKRGPFCGLT